MGYKKKTDKVYIRLRGDEVAQPKDEKRANAFMLWYADNMDLLKRELKGKGVYDEDIVISVALSIYDAIAYKNARIDSNKGYYMRTYYHARLADKIRTTRNDMRYTPIDSSIAVIELSPEFETNTAQLDAEIMGYVRGQFDKKSVCIFEIYIALYPNVTYGALAQLLGYNLYSVEALLCEVKKDIAQVFGQRRAFLLSRDDNYL